MLGQDVKEPQGGSPGERLLAWQARLLRVVLLASGGTLFFAALVATVFKGSIAADLGGTALAGLLLLALSFRAKVAPRLMSHLCVVVLFLTFTSLGYRFAWAPSIVAGYCALTVVAGLLLGRWGVFSVLGGGAMLLLVGGYFLQSSTYFPLLQPSMDPSLFSNWVRVGILVAVITGATSWVLKFAMRVLEEAEAETRRSLQVLGNEMSLTDKTRDRRRVREGELRDAQKLQTAAQLGRGLAHMLNNVLTVVNAALVEAEHELHPADSEAVAARILKATAGSAEKTRDLLLLTSPHAAEGRLLPVHEALADLSDSLRRRLRDNIDWETDLSEVGALRIPRSWLEQMAMNLLLNAEQAMPEGGLIRLATRLLRVTEEGASSDDALAPGLYAAVIVTDTGEGLSHEEALRACDPFFTTKGRDAHDGLGLTIAYGMAKELGGTLDIASDEGGTTATIYLALTESNVPENAKITENLPPLQRLVSGEKKAPRAGFEEVAPLSPEKGEESPLHWRDLALRRLAKLSTVVSTSGLFFSTLLLRSDLKYLTLAVGVPIVILLGFVSWRPNWPYRFRLWALLGGGAIFACAILINFSFLNPSPIALLVTLVLVGAVYAPRATLPLIGAQWLVFLLVGWLYAQGVFVAPLSTVSPSSAANWFRFAATLVPLNLIVAFASLSVFESGRLRIREMLRVRKKLARGRSLREEETQALARVEQMATRSTRMEAAGRLTGTLAHDINGCLQAMVGWAELLKRARKPGDIDRALVTIRQSTHYAEALVQKLQVGRAEAPIPSILNAGATLASMGHMLQEVVRRSGDPPGELHLQVEDDCYIGIDELSWRRLVLNLCTNARDALVGGGVCTIRLFREESLVVLVVEDDGTGMSTETQKRIFEPFYTTKKHQGTGLGLHSVREILEGAGGKMEVQSEVGQGSRFTLRWPLMKARAARGSQRLVGAVNVAGSARVLLVEDEPLVRHTLETGLVSSGYEVVAAQDGDAAAQRLSSGECFDILCTDAIMPGLPTQELISLFGAYFPEAPVLLISGYVPDGTFSHALENPKVSFLHKPFSIAALAKEIETCLE